MIDMCLALVDTEEVQLDTISDTPVFVLMTGLDTEGQDFVCFGYLYMDPGFEYEGLKIFKSCELVDNIVDNFGPLYFELVINDEFEVSDFKKVRAWKLFERKTHKQIHNFMLNKNNGKLFYSNPPKNMNSVLYGDFPFENISIDPFMYLNMIETESRSSIPLTQVSNNQNADRPRLPIDLTQKFPQDLLHGGRRRFVGRKSRKMCKY
jgi:hypothetical protein